MTKEAVSRETKWKRFEHPVAFWSGAAACAAGAVLHIPVYYSMRSMGYRWLESVRTLKCSLEWH